MGLLRALMSALNALPSAAELGCQMHQPRAANLHPTAPTQRSKRITTTYSLALGVAESLNRCARLLCQSPQSAVTAAQDDAIAAMVEVMKAARRRNPATLFVVGSYHIGKERAYLGAAAELGWKVWCPAAKRRVSLWCAVQASGTWRVAAAGQGSFAGRPPGPCPCFACQRGAATADEAGYLSMSAQLG